MSFVLCKLFPIFCNIGLKTISVSSILTCATILHTMMIDALSYQFQNKTKLVRMSKDNFFCMVYYYKGYVTCVPL